MDSSPQTPDADTRLTESSTLTPEPPSTDNTATLMPPQHTTTTTTLMPPPREPSRPGSARTRGQQSSVPHSTSLLNEKNRIVRKYPVMEESLNRESQRGNDNPAAGLRFKLKDDLSSKSCSFYIRFSGSIRALHSG